MSIEEQIFNVGDAVFWRVTTRSYVSERAGNIVAAVPPLIHANDMNFGEIVSPKMSVRNNWSYLVRTPISPLLFWVSSPQPLPEDKMALMEAQKPFTTKRQAPAQSIDKSDRLKLKKWLRKVDAEFTESDKYINILSGDKRVVFNTQNGVEYIESIEEIKFQ